MVLNVDATCIMLESADFEVHVRTLYMLGMGNQMGVGVDGVGQ